MKKNLRIWFTVNHFYKIEGVTICCGKNTWIIEYKSAGTKVPKLAVRIFVLE